MIKIENLKIGQELEDDWGGILIVKEILKTRVKLEGVYSLKNHWNAGEIITYDKSHLQFLKIINNGTQI